MVWFQCEDCGENLKKPKLLNHFNRCSAYKLSCIDCGVVFDQQSVQAHTSCVTEAEKYGPKGLNRGVSGSASKASNGKENGPDLDVSRGLSTFPPWSCSLCNVNATSSETLDLHSQGKKHRSRAKAAASKEKNATKGGGTDVDTELTKGMCKDESKDVETKETKLTSTVNATLSVEKKRKKERTDEAGDIISQETEKLEKLDKKLKRATRAAVGTLPTADDGEGISEVVRESREKKRKHVEEQQATIPGEEQKVTGKKSRKKDKLASRGVNGHDSDELEAQKVAEISGTGGKAKNVEQVRKKEKGRCKHPMGSPLDKIVGDGKGQTLAVENNGVDGLFVDNTTFTKEFGAVPYDYNTGKKSKKSKGLVDADDRRVLEMLAKVKEEDNSNNSKREKKKNNEKRETVVHEVSFREWLGEEEDGVPGGTPTHPPSDNMVQGKENLQHLDQKTREAIHKLERARSESTQDGLAKVVKWKKIIRETLGKLIQSVNGRLKKKEFTRAALPLAQKAIESSAVSVDRKTLKAELMRQVSNSPKFVVDGRHIMLSPKVK